MSLYRLIEPIKAKIRSILNRAIVSRVDDTQPIQLIQITVLKGEVKDGVERIQDYGLSSRPSPGAEALVGFLNGNKDQGIVIKADDSRVRRKNLEEGEVSLYDKNGSYVLLKSNGDVIVVPSSGKVYLGGDNLVALDGVVTGQCICAFTGVAHPDKSTKVFARKI